MGSLAIIITHIVLTVILSLAALASSIFLIYRIIRYERQKVDETEKHAFELYDAVFQSFIPRTLGDKLAHIYRIEINPSAMTDNRAVIATTAPGTVLPSPNKRGTAGTATTGGGTTDQTKSNEKK